MDEYYSGFEKRKEYLIECVASQKGNTLAHATARFEAGKDIDFALEIVREHLKKDNGWMFDFRELMVIYLKYSSYLPDDLIKYFRERYFSINWLRGDTENHRAEYYTAVLLAAQTFPDENNWFNGKSSGENYDDAVKWFNDWLELTVTRGQGEYDSPNYTSLYFMLLYAIYDFAEDPVLRHKAKMMLDLLIADYAVDYLKGIYTGGHSRECEPQTLMTKYHTGLVQPYGYLYFGNCEYDVNTPQTDRVIYGVISSYRIPYFIYKMAVDREEPYENFEIKRCRQFLRYFDPEGDNVYKYGYMTKNFCLGSTIGEIPIIEGHRWDVSWKDDRDNSTIYSMHPYYSEKALARYFNEFPGLLLPQTEKYRTYLLSDKKMSGGSPYEQTHQHKNNIIVLYNIPDDDNTKKIRMIFPKNLRMKEVDDSGWIFCSGGTTYIACYPLKPYDWSEEDIYNCAESVYTKNGLVMIVYPSGKFVSFDDFKENVLKSEIKYKEIENNPEVTFVNPEGDILEFGYNGSRIINGKEINYKKWDRFKNPFISQKQNSKIISIRYKNEVEILDFSEFTITNKITE